MTSRNMYQDIRAALDQWLTQLDALPTTDDGTPRVNWEGTQFQPEPGESYLRTHLLPAEPSGRSAGGTHWLRLQGIYQLTVLVQSGRGPRAADEISDAIHRHFKSGKRLTKDSTTVTVSSVSRGPAGSDESWYWIPVSIYWRSYTDQF